MTATKYLPPDDYETWKSNSATPRQRLSNPELMHESEPENNKTPSPPRPPPPKEHQKSQKGFNCCYSIFGTRQLYSERDRETYIRVTIRELTIYIIYLAVLCTLTFGTTSSSTYYFTKAMTDVFLDPVFNSGNHPKSFRESTNIDDFWHFVEGPMISGLYKEMLYNDKVSRPSSSLSPKLFTKNGILVENKLIGAPRLRQLRVKADACEVAANFRRFVRQCFAPYSISHEDTTKNWRREVTNETAWTYFTEKELKGSTYWGRLTTYSGAGSYVTLKVDDDSSSGTSNNNNDTGSAASPTAPELTKAIIADLKKKHWITRATRAVFLDFTVYNANINLFCIVKLVWEMPATGGVLTSWHLRTVNLIRYTSRFDLFLIFPCEIIFCIFTLYYTIQELLEFFHLGCKRYFCDIWSWMDISILGFSYVCIAFRIYTFVLALEKLKDMNMDKTNYISFEKIGFWQSCYNYCLAVCIFLAWIKIFKYISFNKTMTQLSATLSRCAADIGGFAIMFFIVFAAFAQLGYLMFGSQVQDFSTFLDSVFTLLRLILGDFNFRQIEAANSFLGPIFFIAYVFFVFFVLMNMFLAIINDTFGEVKAEIQARRNEFEIADYFKRGFNNLRGCCGKKDERLDAKYNVKLASSDGQITYDELRKNLEQAGFSDVEIEMFLARYELDHNRVVDEDEIQHVLAELEGNHGYGHAGDGPTSYFRSAHEKLVEDAVQQEEIDDMQKRVGMIETSLTSLMYKIDNVVHKLEKMK